VLCVTLNYSVTVSDFHPQCSYQCRIGNPITFLAAGFVFKFCSC